MNKKVISSVLAGAMAVSTLGVTVFAAPGNTSEGNASLSAKASLMTATIDANLPQDFETFINPYGAAVSTSSTDTMINDIKNSDGIISPTYMIQNLDNAAGLKVSATAKITGSSTVTLMTKPMDDVKLEKATEKQVFAFLNTTTDATGTTADKTAKPIFLDTKFVGNSQQVAFSEEGTKAKDIMTLPKVATKDTAEVKAMGFFYVGGQCTPNPETAWDSKDTVTVDLILDLSPSMGDPADLSLASIMVKSSTAGATAASIEKEFDGTKKVYELVAKGSKDKYSEIVVTAKANNTVVYARFNGKLYTAAQTASLTEVKAAAPSTAAANAAGKMTVNPKNGTVAPATSAADQDFAVGDVLEFIVVDATTNASTTYTFNFT